MSPHFRVSNHKCISGIYHMCYKPCLTHPSEICIPIVWGEAHNSCSSLLHLSLQTPVLPPPWVRILSPVPFSNILYLCLSLLRYHILLPHKTPGKVQFLWGLYFFNTKTTYPKICTQQLHTSLHLAINKAATLTQTLTQNLLVWA